MAVHMELAQKGEEMAARYLEEKGYTILHRNWRHAHLEIDLIAYHEPVLHFIEVKLRSSNKFLPEKSVSKKKFRHLLKAADEFLYRHPQYRHIQFDIMAITLGREPGLFFIEDVYL
ncbi:MAG TPA: YraN family protein [Flavisolibacter sp.]|jgi:putative endonuclease